VLDLEKSLISQIPLIIVVDVKKSVGVVKEAIRTSLTADAEVYTIEVSVPVLITALITPLD
jgi:hypothetical protein